VPAHPEIRPKPESAERVEAELDVAAWIDEAVAATERITLPSL